MVDENVIVPKSDLIAVEIARKALYDLLEEQLKDTAFQVKLQQITSSFWKVGNTNYPPENQ